MAASWASSESSFKGVGCNATGASTAMGGNETRVARGADVCGTIEAVGAQVGLDGAATLAWRDSLDACLDEAADCFWSVGFNTPRTRVVVVVRTECS